MNTSGHSARRAFTLIEILMVMVLIGILAGFAVSRVNVTGYRMDANIRLLQNALIGAQQTAITRNVSVQVMFDASAQQVRIHQDVDGNGAVDANETVTYRALDNASFLTPPASASTLDGATAYFVTGTFEELSPVWRAIRFAPNGALGGDAVVYIGSTLDRPNDLRAMTIVGATGRTGFWSHGGGSWVQRSY